MRLCHVVGGEGEVRCHPCDEVESDGDYYETYYEGAQYVAVGEGEYHHEDVEHAGEGCQRQELVAGEYYGEDEGHGDEEEGNDEGRGVTDDECRRHADVQFLVCTELLGDKLARGLRDRLQTLDEEGCDARDKLHDGTHLDAQSECGRNLVDEFGGVLASQTADDDADDDTEEERFAEETELLLHALRVDVNLVDARYVVQCLVDDDGEGHEALAERLWDGDAVHAFVEALELLGGEVGKHEGDDVADDGSEEAPCQ